MKKEMETIKTLQQLKDYVDTKLYKLTKEKIYLKLDEICNLNKDFTYECGYELGYNNFPTCLRISYKKEHIHINFNTLEKKNNLIIKLKESYNHWKHSDTFGIYSPYNKEWEQMFDMYTEVLRRNRDNDYNDEILLIIYKQIVLKNETK